MEPLSDQELQALLREWEAPGAPQALEQRIFSGPRKELWARWLLTGSVRIPVPVFVLLILILSALAYVVPHQRQAPPALVVRELKLSDFQPVAELKPRIIRRSRETN